MTASKDAGLKSILSWLGRAINNELMPWLDPEEDFQFEWVGFDTKSDKEKTDLIGEQVTKFKTIDEVREEMGLDPLPDDLGKIILNQVFISVKQQTEMAKQQAEQQGQQASIPPELAQYMGQEGQPEQQAGNEGLDMEQQTGQNQGSGGEPWKALPKGSPEGPSSPQEEGGDLW